MWPFKRRIQPKPKQVRAVNQDAPLFKVNAHRVCPPHPLWGDFGLCIPTIGQEALINCFGPCSTPMLKLGPERLQFNCPSDDPGGNPFFTDCPGGDCCFNCGDADCRQFECWQATCTPSLQSDFARRNRRMASKSRTQTVNLTLSWDNSIVCFYCCEWFHPIGCGHYDGCSSAPPFGPLAPKPQKLIWYNGESVGLCGGYDNQPADGKKGLLPANCATDSSNQIVGFTGPCSPFCYCICPCYCPGNSPCACGSNGCATITPFPVCPYCSIDGFFAKETAVFGGCQGIHIAAGARRRKAVNNGLCPGGVNDPNQSCANTLPGLPCNKSYSVTARLTVRIFNVSARLFKRFFSRNCPPTGANTQSTDQSIFNNAFNLSTQPTSLMNPPAPVVAGRLPGSGSFTFALSAPPFLDPDCNPTTAINGLNVVTASWSFSSLSIGSIPQRPGETCDACNTACTTPFCITCNTSTTCTLPGITCTCPLPPMTTSCCANCNNTCTTDSTSYLGPCRSPVYAGQNCINNAQVTSPTFTV